MSPLKILAVAAAAATFGIAFAQGTPPGPATDPATGAGQRSTQTTPMGDSGTPGGTGAAGQRSTAGAAGGATSGATAAGTGSASSSGSMSSGATAANTDTSGSKKVASAKTGAKKAVRKPRADRG